jgi:hypothetical protein
MVSLAKYTSIGLDGRAWMLAKQVLRKKKSNRILLALFSVISSSERLAMLIDEQDRSELFKREERPCIGNTDRGNSVEKRLVHEIQGGEKRNNF